MNETERWASEYGRFRTKDEIITEFREMEQQKRADGWKRNVRALLLVLAVAALIAWLKWH